MWRKRRYRCPETRCAQRVFTERSEQIPPRHRLTGRLRVRLEQAASRCGRALSDVAAEYRVSWWSVHRSLVVAAAARTPATLPPVRRLGLDETRARSLRWAFDPDIAKWRLSDPWMTSFVDLDTDRPGWLLGLVPGRSGAAVTGWLSERDQAWRATRSRSSRWTRRRRSPPRSAGCCRRPPSWSTTSTWSVWPTQMLTEVRQRVAREQLGRRGRKADAAWAHRRLLLAAGDRLSRRGLDRLTAVLHADDPTNEIGAAWGVKELLRQLLACTETHPARRALFAFYDAVLVADLPEATRLAETIQTWWPAIEAFLRLRVTNARTEGTNRVIKQIKRVGCGYRNQANYERRILLHVAAKNAA